ncbi:hypothetical protein HD554DRAFT_2221544 [Boletus coccyginus]|nr:hypothetical protein HD554DRAFT_2221544 [Boletus coccyginus]
MTKPLGRSIIDMPWPAEVVRQFQTVSPNADESDFLGPYNKLLNTLFPPDSDFTVAPQFLKSDPADPSDYISSFEIFFKNWPVFALQLKKPGNLKYKSSRATADQLIRIRVADSAGDRPIPILHAVSAFGSRLCFYHLDTANTAAGIFILPRRIPHHPTMMNDTAPMERWNCDVMDAEGETRLRAVVDSIKAACEDIADA